MLIARIERFPKICKDRFEEPKHEGEQEPQHQPDLNRLNSLYIIILFVFQYGNGSLSTAMFYCSLYQSLFLFC